MDTSPVRESSAAVFLQIHLGGGVEVEDERVGAEAQREEGDFIHDLSPKGLLTLSVFRV